MTERRYHASSDVVGIMNEPVDLRPALMVNVLLCTPLSLSSLSFCMHALASLTPCTHHGGDALDDAALADVDVVSTNTRYIPQYLNFHICWILKFGASIMNQNNLQHKQSTKLHAPHRHFCCPSRALVHRQPWPSCTVSVLTTLHVCHTR